MKFKSFVIIGLAFYLVGLNAKDPFGTIILDGGKVVPLVSNTVGSTTEHMNFCFANNFPDGSIYMNHSEGIHTVSEHGVQRRSLDGGKTWEKVPFPFGGFNTYVNKAGKVCQVNSWEINSYTTEHTITTQILKADHSGIENKFTSKITLPFESIFLLHREVIRTQDDRLLLSGYGRKKGVSKFFSFVIESKDDGKTWQYLSTIMEDQNDKRYGEGPNETTILQLRNGDILAYVRTGGPLTQLRSKDGGKTWGDKIELDKYGVAPAARVLKDGTVVVVSGRPATKLYIDFSGEGKDYQCVQIYGGSGSSYASVLEIAPNQIMCIYDESDFGAWKNLSHFSKIMAVTYNVVKDDSLKYEKPDHPKAKEYQRFYFPKCMEGMEYRSLYTGFKMLPRKEAEANGAWYEIQNIAERPHPILHMEFKGLVHPYSISHYYANLSPAAEYEKGKVGFEIRLGDMAEKRPQFIVLFGLKKSNVSAFIKFTVDGLECISAGKTVKVPYPMGLKFYAFRLEIDGNTKTYKVFEDNTGKVLFSGATTDSNRNCNHLLLGDGSAQVFGAVDLSYFGYTLE